MDAKELLISPLAYMPPGRIIEGLSPEQSAEHFPGLSHSAVEILAHMVYWQSWFLDRCAGRAILPAQTASLGWPAAGAKDWELLCARFREHLGSALEIGLDASAAARRVDPPIEFPQLANYTLGDCITHIAMHNAHHLGQIITIRQLLGAWPPPRGSFTW